MKYFKTPFTKEALYFCLHFLKLNLHIDSSNGIFIAEHLQSIDKDLVIKPISFQTSGLRGMAFIPDEDTPPSILLNSNRNECKQNYDCGHEFLHLTFDKNQPNKIFECYDSVKSFQNNFIEWRANEGAAELLVPYKILLPLIKDYIGDDPKLIDFKEFKIKLTKKFHVPERVIHYRIDNLKYEIDQFINGTNMDDIKIMSDAEQKRHGISITSLNIISDFATDLEDLPF